MTHSLSVHSASPASTCSGWQRLIRCIDACCEDVNLWHLITNVGTLSGCSFKYMISWRPVRCNTLVIRVMYKSDWITLTRLILSFYGWTRAKSDSFKLTEHSLCVTTGFLLLRLRPVCLHYTCAVFPPPHLVHDRQMTLRCTGYVPGRCNTHTPSHFTQWLWIAKIAGQIRFRPKHIVKTGWSRV